MVDGIVKAGCDDCGIVVPVGAILLTGEITCKYGWIVHTLAGVVTRYAVHASHYSYEPDGMVHVVRPDEKVGLFFEAEKIEESVLEQCVHPPCGYNDIDGGIGFPDPPDIPYAPPYYYVGDAGRTVELPLQVGATI